jgi:hypothetical protein
LSEPGLSPTQLKQLRLLISSIKAYATLSLGYMNAYGGELGELVETPALKPMPQPKKGETIADRVAMLKNLLKEGTSKV